jgi:hypothetical protein
VASKARFIGVQPCTDTRKVRQASIARGINGIDSFQNKFKFLFSWFKSSDCFPPLLQMPSVECAAHEVAHGADGSGSRFFPKAEERKGKLP